MSTDNFVKGECARCAGHLEFPAAAAGETIVCPHCGQSTVLVLPSASTKPLQTRRLFVVSAVGLVLLGGLLTVVILVKRSSEQKLPVNPNPQTAISNPPPLMDEAITNDFAVSTFKLEKVAGSSLVYVTGSLRNLTDRQRFGVKVEFGLLDAKGLFLGKATDYNRLLEAHASWAFKALVMESKVVSARLNSVSETP
jgi:hypothetical protein